MTALARIVLGDVAAVPAPSEVVRRRGIGSHRCRARVPGVAGLATIAPRSNGRRFGTLIACLAVAALVLGNAAAQHVHVDDHEHAEDDCAICAVAVKDSDSSARPALAVALARTATVRAQPAQSPRRRAPRDQRQRGPPLFH